MLNMHDGLGGERNFCAKRAGEGSEHKTDSAKPQLWMVPWLFLPQILLWAAKQCQLEWP